MSISEKQFAEMIKGTVHEGKYGNKPKEEPVPEKPPKETPQMKNAAGVFMKVLPWAAGIRLATNGTTWLILLVLLIFVYSMLQPLVSTILQMATYWETWAGLGISVGIGAYMNTKFGPGFKRK